MKYFFFLNKIFFVVEKFPMANFKAEYENYFSKSKKEDDFESFYDEIDILEFIYHKETQQFTYPCPCGDLFIISLQDLRNGETVARCPSCSLIVFAVYSDKDLMKYSDEP